MVFRKVSCMYILMKPAGRYYNATVHLICLYVCGSSIISQVRPSSPSLTRAYSARFKAIWQSFLAEYVDPSWGWPVATFTQKNRKEERKKKETKKLIYHRGSQIFPLILYVSYIYAAIYWTDWTIYRMTGRSIDMNTHAHLCQISDLCTQFTLNSVDGGLELVQLSV